MYDQNYSVIPLSRVDHGGLIPVASRWVGSWRLSIDRRAHSVSELTERYDGEAANWQETLTRLGVAGAYQSLAARLYERLASFRSNTPIRVLECGAGTATLSRALAGMHSKPIQLSAVDISVEMIRQARGAFDEAGLAVDLRVADIRKLPYADDSQDVVIAAHVLEHLADPASALDEMYRVLKPGGLIVLCCTRRSLAGRWIQMKWRTHTVTEPLMQDWLNQHAFENVEPLMIDSGSRLNQLSLAMTAIKPVVARRAHDFSTD